MPECACCGLGTRETALYYVVDHLGYIISAHRTWQAAQWKILRYHDANDYHVEEASVLGWLYEVPKRQRAVRRQQQARGLLP